MKSLFDIADLLAIKNELKDLSPAISNRSYLTEIFQKYSRPNCLRRTSVMD